VKVAPKRGDVLLAVRLVATGGGTTVTTVTVVVAVLVGSSTDVAVMVTLLTGAAGAVQTLLAQVPTVEDQVTSLVAPPVTVAVKVVWDEVPTVGVAGLIAPTLTTWGVTVAVVVAVTLAELVTVKVKTLAPAQLAVMALEATPVAGQVTLLSMVPVPSLYTGVRVKVAPKAGVVLLAVRLVATGAATGALPPPPPPPEQAMARSRAAGARSRPAKRQEKKDDGPLRLEDGGVCCTVPMGIS
jgi:hypothetical protein